MPSVLARPGVRHAGLRRIARIIGLSLLLVGVYVLCRVGPSALGHGFQMH